MSVTLIASEKMPLQEVCSLITNEGVAVSALWLDSNSQGTLPAASADTFFLLLGEQELISGGEITGRVRQALGDEKTLVVCMPMPIDRAALLEMGADEIITPATVAVRQIAERVLGQLILLREIEPRHCGVLYGASWQMRKLYSHVETLAPLDDPVLILGETGTGKELAAREIHERSTRGGPYVAVNCAELNAELLGSELFGHEKGAFTGAVQTRKGLIAEAGEGTIFLDEIGDLDLQAQAKLLRVLEERKIRRVGANRWEDVKARVLLATNRNLEEDCQAGQFREDLFERIRGFTIEMPPLRERRADIPLLVEQFVGAYSHEYKRQLKVPPVAVDSLFRYHWPGNVRELRAAVRRAAAYADKDDYVSALILQEATRGRKVIEPKNTIEFDPSSNTWRDVQRTAQVAYFKAVLAEAKGNKNVAIKLSGLSKSQFYEKLKDSGLL